MLTHHQPGASLLAEAQQLFDARRYDEAADKAEDVLQLEPDRADLLEFHREARKRANALANNIDEGEHSLENGDLAAAKNAWQRVRALDPEHHGAREALERIHQHQWDDGLRKGAIALETACETEQHAKALDIHTRILLMFGSDEVESDPDVARAFAAYRELDARVSALRDTVEIGITDGQPRATEEALEALHALGYHARQLNELRHCLGFARRRHRVARAIESSDWPRAVAELERLPAVTDMALIAEAEDFADAIWDALAGEFRAHRAAASYDEASDVLLELRRVQVVLEGLRIARIPAPDADGLAASLASDRAAVRRAKRVRVLLAGVALVLLLGVLAYGLS